MSVCCCSLAGTKACDTCSSNTNKIINNTFIPIPTYQELIRRKMDIEKMLKDYYPKKNTITIEADDVSCDWCGEIYQNQFCCPRCGQQENTIIKK